MLQSHYRSPVDYSENSLAEARSGLVRCYTALQLLKETLTEMLASTASVADKNSVKEKNYISKLKELEDKFNAAMDDDFNTAQALGYVFDLVRFMNNFIVAGKNTIAFNEAEILKKAKKLFDHFGAVLGIFQDEPDYFFQSDKEMESNKRGLNIGEIENLIKERQTARKDKDWARADTIRNELGELHVILKDSHNTTSWIIE
jgi:cysteinyl-tRNA synthetase